ncbi:MAG: prolyl oligopeptidase family serine peptidase, partial [Melioribacteraceae bacterium]
NLVYINGELHTGNRYGSKDVYESWEPRFDYSQIPIELKKGDNEFLFQVSVGKFKATLIRAGSGIFFNTKDATLPDLLVGNQPGYFGAVVVINATSKPLEHSSLIAASVSGGEEATPIDIIQPMSIRKIRFVIKGENYTKPGSAEYNLKIVDNASKNILAESTINFRIVNPSENHKVCFISRIDGSVQYYSVNPASDNDTLPKALFLSVHGASVEAINQSGSYFPKKWGHIVSPTNRRPYGFNWEDWGRIDAMEVYDLALGSLNIDRNRVYLTGHSMGGHGTWHLGATFPDKFAAIGPSAGWISFWSYRVREKNENPSEMEKVIMRSANSSDTYALAENYKQQGVYVIHGADDDNVRASESRNMIEHLKKFHSDFIYHEQPGAGHWWDNSDDNGADCVDWAPLFDFFARHSIPQKNMVREIDFITASPGISARNHWVWIHSQIKQFNMSRISIRLDPGKNRLVGKTENIARLKFDSSVMDPARPLLIELDGQLLTTDASKSFYEGIWLGIDEGKWRVLDSTAISGIAKHPARYGMFKSAVNNNVVFIYGTNGDEAENEWAFQKARYDAEQFWYQGNGSIKVISDKQFNRKDYPANNFLIYGNSETNLAWNILLGDSPVQIKKGKVRIGSKEFSGKDLACLFVRPVKGSDYNTVGVVSGSGLEGMKLTDRRLYLQPGYPFPDLMLFDGTFTSKGIDGVKSAGYFGLDWTVENGEFVWSGSK